MQTENKKSFLSHFYPNNEILEKLSLREKTQLPVIIVTNIIWVVLFSITGILISFNVFIGGIASIATSFVFAMSLVQVKKGRISFASKLATVGVSMLGFIVAFFTTRFQSPMVFYKTVCMLIIMAACNLPICLDNKQHIVFMIISLVTWISSSFTIYLNLFQEDFKGSIIAFSICSIGLTVSNGGMFLATQFFNRLIKEAEKNSEHAKSSINKITKVIEESKEGLNIGQKLLSNAESASSSVSEISALYRFLFTETENLNSETSNLQSASAEISRRSSEMKASVSEQNAAITQTSAAVTEISANITNINGIASKRRAGMNDIVASLDSQMALIKQLVEKVEKVNEYSKSIEAFVNTVESISSQTGLLAMNASIEAAHAGTLGKGFSVIAQEIRKLSEETSKNATLISETLKENSKIVNETTTSVSAFADSTLKSSEEIKTTIQAIEEILAGISEMDIGTQEVMRALQSIVDDSRTNADLISGVVTEIDFQSNSIDNIAEFTRALDDRVGGLDELIRIIKIAIAEIRKQAEQNQVIANKIVATTDEV